MLQVSGTQVASASDDQTLRVWDIDLGDMLHVLGHDGWLNTLAFKGDTCITAGSEGKVFVWNTDTGNCLAILEGGRTSLLGSARLLPSLSLP